MIANAPMPFGVASAHIVSFGFIIGTKVKQERDEFASIPLKSKLLLII
jgi:hypothetical protein